MEKDQEILSKQQEIEKLQERLAAIETKGKRIFLMSDVLNLRYNHNLPFLVYLLEHNMNIFELVRFKS